MNIQIKVLRSAVLLNMLYKVVLTFKSVHETLAELLVGDHSNQSD